MPLSDATKHINYFSIKVGGVDNVVYVYNGVSFSLILFSLLYTTTWMDLWDIVLNELSWIQKN